MPLVSSRGNGNSIYVKGGMVVTVFVKRGDGRVCV